LNPQGKKLVLSGQKEEPDRCLESVCFLFEQLPVGKFCLPVLRESGELGRNFVYPASDLFKADLKPRPEEELKPKPEPIDGRSREIE